jgi:hypothetical protein
MSFYRGVTPPATIGGAGGEGPWFVEIYCGRLDLGDVLVGDQFVIWSMPDAIGFGGVGGDPPLAYACGGPGMTVTFVEVILAGHLILAVADDPGGAMAVAHKVTGNVTFRNCD